MSEPSFIELSDVSLRYGTGTVALARTSLSIDAGDFVALVGPSGCGKSTILKLVAGLLQPTAGGVIVRGREQGSPSVGGERLRLGIAFQNPTMLPWLTIRENVMIPLKIVPPFRASYRAKRHGEFAERAEALLAQVGLKPPPPSTTARSSRPNSKEPPHKPPRRAQVPFCAIRDHRCSAIRKVTSRSSSSPTISAAIARPPIRASKN